MTGWWPLRSSPYLVLFHKCDHVQPGSIEIAIGKAKTAGGHNCGGKAGLLSVNGINICPIQADPRRHAENFQIIYDGQRIGAMGCQVS